MKKLSIICCIAAGALIVAGLITALCAAASANFDYHIFTGEERTETFEIGEAFTSIEIASDCSVEFLRAEDGRAKVVYTGVEAGKRSAEARDGKLVVRSKKDNSFFGVFRFGFLRSKLTVYLPETSYDALNVKGSTGDLELAKTFTFGKVHVEQSTGDVKCYSSVTQELYLHASTGDVRVSGASCASLDVKTSTGDVKLEDVKVENSATVAVTTGSVNVRGLTCASLKIDSSTGDIRLTDAVCAGQMTVTASTGDVTFGSCDAAEMRVKTSTGDVRGTLRTEKTFIVDTSTGDARYPRETRGGKCTISTSTGDVNIRIEE